MVIGDNAIAGGAKSKGSGNFNVVIGSSAAASGSNNLALGNLASASGTSAVAMGNSALASSGSIAIGLNASTVDAKLGGFADAVAIGNNAQSLATGAVHSG